MNKLWSILLISFLFTGCDKIEKTQKILTGVWSIHQYRYTVASGLSYFYDAEGTMDYGSCDGELCNYSLNMTYYNQSLLEKIESGTIDLINDETFVLNRNNADGSTTLLDYGRILLVTKDDLKMEFKDESGLHQFVFQK